MKEISLIDYLAWQKGLEYVSDLRMPENLKREKFRYVLSKQILSGNFSDRDWLDTCEYLTDRKPVSAEQARKYLLDYVKGDFA